MQGTSSPTLRGLRNQRQNSHKKKSRRFAGHVAVSVAIAVTVDIAASSAPVLLVLQLWVISVCLPLFSSFISRSVLLLFLVLLLLFMVFLLHYPSSLLPSCFSSSSSSPSSVPSCW